MHIEAKVGFGVGPIVAPSVSVTKTASVCGLRIAGVECDCVEPG